MTPKEELEQIVKDCEALATEIDDMRVSPTRAVGFLMSIAGRVHFVVEGLPQWLNSISTPPARQ